MSKATFELEKIQQSCEQIESTLGVIEQLYKRNGRPHVSNKEEAQGLVLLVKDLQPSVNSIKVSTTKLLNEGNAENA